MAMHALVVYESLFGNTLQVAQAVAEGIRSEHDGSVIEVAEVGSRPAVGPDVDLLVIGGPTHAFGMTRPTTRDSARSQAKGEVAASADISHDIGVREWLDALPAARSHLLCAAFDTRTNAPRVPGSAARGMGKRLRAKGYGAAAEPHTFWVNGVEGPVLDGELEKARDWGRELATATRTHSW
jgi:hypothetical protein